MSRKYKKAPDKHELLWLKNIVTKANASISKRDFDKKIKNLKNDDCNI